MLQDSSATDSEEIIYPIRAPSSCSAPPDLLMTTGQDQTDCSGHRQSLNASAAAAATTTNCHNSPVASCNGEQQYQVHRRMRQKLMDQQQQHQRQSRTAAKENLKVAANDQVVTVATEELVRLEVSYFCRGKAPRQGN